MTAFHGLEDRVHDVARGAVRSQTQMPFLLPTASLVVRGSLVPSQLV